MKKLGIHIVVLLLFCVFTNQVNAQLQPAKYGKNDTIIVGATVMEDGTVIPTSSLPNVDCNGIMPHWLREKMKEWTRLRNAVYVTYPYAKQAGIIINEINAKLAGVTDPAVRKRYIKEREADLRKSFADKITNLSVYQGKILMKLINRQTGNNCYEILKEYKGGFNARVYQTVAFFFGSSLKQTYDPNGEDAEIESIVKDVEKLYKG